MDIGPAALQTVLGQIAEGYIVSDPTGTIIGVNAGATALLGVEPQVLAGSCLQAYVGAESLPVLEALIAELHKHTSLQDQYALPQPLQRYLLLQRPTVQVPGFEVTAVPERDPERGLVRIHWLLAPAAEADWGPPGAGVLMQTAGPTFAESDRHHARALGSHPWFLEHLTQTAEIAIAILDASDYRYLYANPFLAKMLGRAGEVLVGHRVVDVLGAQAGRDMVAMLERARATGKALHIHEYETEMAPGQPQTFWDVEVLPMTNAGVVSRLVVVGHEITTQVRARREADRLAAQSEAILDSLTEGVIVSDMGGRIITFNPAARGLLGFSETEDAPTTLAEIFTAFQLFDLTGRALRPAEWPMARLLHDAEPVMNELMRVVSLADAGEWIGSCSGSLVRDASGTPYLVVLTFRNITARVQAERERVHLVQELRRLAERLAALRDMDRAVLEAATIEEMAASALPWLRDALGCCLVSLVLFDAPAGEILAYTANGSRQADAVRLLQCHESQAPMLHGSLGVMDRGPVIVEEIEDAESTPPDLKPILALLRPAGIRAFSAIPLATSERVLGALVIGLERPGRLDREQFAIAQEVSAEFAVAIRQGQLREEVRQHAARMELRVAERTAELQASEARFRAMYENAAIGIAVIDLGGYILQVNPAAQRMVGHAEDELIGAHFSAFSDPAKRERETLVLDQLARGEINTYRGEKGFRTTEGRDVWVRLSISLVRDGEGAPSFIFGMLEDITAERAAEEALQRAEKLLLTGRLAASLAHDIGNPLQTIVGCLGLARESLGPGAELALRHMEMAASEAHRAAGMVRQLRDLNRHARPEERVPVDVVALVEKVLELAQSEVLRRDVEVVFVAPAPAPRVRAALDQMHQVFANLVQNAIEAMPEGGRLEVRMEETRHPDGVSISFSDTGLGISEETAQHLFEPFYTTKKEGLGLGLYVTNGIVESHGGKIEMESVPGEGTTFRVWLPAAAAD